MSVGQGDSGNSDGGSAAAQAATVAALQGQGSPQGTQPASTGQQQQQQTPSAPPESDLVQGLLKDVDPAHAEILKPYVSKWDAGVTKKIQEIHDQYAPYKDLGDPDALAQASELIQMLEDDPLTTYQRMGEALKAEGLLDDGGQPPAGVPEGQQKSVLGSTQALPPAIQQQFDALTQAVEYLASQHIEKQTTEAEQQEDAQLDSHLADLRKNLGEFDDDYVLAKMAAGMTGEEAVKAWNSAIQSVVNGRARVPEVPQILGGGGAASQDAQSIIKASSKDVRTMVAQILASSQNS